jgi:phenylalanyl-tRNA synthetase beta subunit
VRENSKYPAVIQDVTFVVKSGIEYKNIENAIYSEINTKGRKASIECLDIYEKKEYEKSITIRISIEHMNKTLSNKDFEKIITKVTEKVSKLQ